MARSVRRVVLLPLVLIIGASAGCIDIRSFAGTWSGTVASEPAVRQGFVDGTRAAPLVLANVDLEGVSARLTTSDRRFTGTTLTRITRFSNDTLASLTFDGDPIRSYLLFALLDSEPDGWPATMVISLFSDEHVELRILRGNDLYGMFYLHREE